MPALDDLRVLDLSTGIAGAYTAKLFADAGADVVMVEGPEGHPLRRWSASGAPIPDGDAGAFFRFLRTSTQSVVADLDGPDGREAFARLVPGADLVIDDHGPGWLTERGLGHPALAAIEPSITLLSVTPWGLEGPWADRPANEWTLQSWVGSTAYRGVPGEMPFTVGGRPAEFLVAANAAALGLGAVLDARRHGRGWLVDCSAYEAMSTSFVTYQHIFATFDPGRLLPRSIEIPSIEPAADGWVGFCTITGQQWKDFCVVVEDPEMGDDDRFVNAERRMTHRDEVWSRIRRYTTAHTVDDIVELATLLRVPVAPIGDGSRVAAIDHFAERGVYVENPAGFVQPRVPYLIDGCPPRPFDAAPELGEHDELLSVAPSPEAAAGTTAAADGPPCPLDGLRVVDLSAFWAGPVAACLLEALGADVIKVESIQRPDGMRWASGLRKDPLWEYSPVFHGANMGKRAITLDLRSDAGLTLVKRLIERADIVIENFSPRVIEDFGLGWDVVSALNPRAVMVRMPAFGLGGPWRDRTGFAMTIEQASGLAFLTGDPDGAPLVPRGFCDQLGGMHTVFAVLCALRHRDETGRGTLVEVPLVEAGLNAAAEQAIEWSAYGALLQREGNRSPYAAPQGLYPAAGDDEWVAVSVDSDAAWAGLCGAIGRPDWAADERLATRGGRREAHDLLDAAIAAWTSTRERDAAVDALLAVGVPAAPVLNARLTIDNPQLAARGYLQWLEHAVAGRVPYPSFPARFDGAYHRYPRPSPALGEHNDEVLSSELGLTAAEIAELRASGVVGERPAGI